MPPARPSCRWAGVNFFTREKFTISFLKYALQTFTIQLPIIAVLHFSNYFFFSKSTAEHSKYSEGETYKYLQLPSGWAS